MGIPAREKMHSLGPFGSLSACVGMILISTSCALECDVTDWSPWQVCSQKCGGGIETRSREQIVPFNATAEDDNATAEDDCFSPPLEESRTCNTHHCSQTKVPFSSVVVWPMDRRDIGNIIDGDTSTWTYSTKGWCKHESIYIGLKLQIPSHVSGLRIHKKYHKSHHNKKDCNRKNIQLLYSTDDPEDRPLDRFNWKQVGEATNGYASTEMLNLQIVRPDGYLFGEEHNSQSDGWGSVSFAPVEATALALEVSANGGEYNHFCVSEIEAFFAPPQAPEAVDL